ncbi:hypothetical protein D9758_004946 [Tetrapyrgos nigripes]|uniref:Polyprotein n=1 Tax=Tetrapyrgos nigripes TaxID=182062 RepID=A0A8H5LWH3_9AGAR|nr:hypothetical protein D9758_004946 [Tetrapyrgos nigripes]
MALCPSRHCGVRRRLDYPSFIYRTHRLRQEQTSRAVHYYGHGRTPLDSWHSNNTRQTESLSQCSYIESVAREFGLENAKPSSVPMDIHNRLTSAQCPQSLSEVLDVETYSYRSGSIVGKLVYAAVGTRVDIAFAVHTLARFLNNPGMAHWKAAKPVVAYLLSTKDATGFVDADGNMEEDRRVVTGYVFVIDGGVVTWSSRSHSLVTLSTCESEYVAAPEAAKEGLWLRSLITQVFKPSFPSVIPGPTTLHSDNQAAIALARDHHYHGRTKHIDIRFHFIRFVIDEGQMQLIYCPTENMLADTLTKALPNIRAKHPATGLGLVPS